MEALGVSHGIKQLEKLKTGGRYEVSIRIPFEYGWIERVKVIFYTFGKRNAYQMYHEKNEKDKKSKKEYAHFKTVIELETQAVYHYYFTYEANGKFMYLKKENTTGDMSVSTSECWKLAVGFDVPYWAKGAIMYHIFVDRFRRGGKEKLQTMPKRTIHQDWDERPVIRENENGLWNVDFYGGNLIGIKETLKYIKSLGVSIIYLSPIVTSQSNHRYDTADYETVDTYAGTNQMLKDLCDEAHKKGIKIILDAVFNHTGNDSKYFNEYGTYDTIGAYQSEASPYYNFYRKDWRNGKKEFSYWWGMKNLPVCDGNSPEWKDYIFGEGGVIDKWFKLGIDGLRLDVADELSDEFIIGIANAVKRNKPDGLIIGEVWKNPMRMNRGYISSGKAMHTVMNYLLVDSLIRYYKYKDVWKLEACLKEVMSEYPTSTIQTLMNFTSTHDISRAIEIFGCHCFQQNGEWAWNTTNVNPEEHLVSSTEFKYGKKMFKSYVFALIFLPGILSIFYGDEVGMQGIGNLANRGSYPWGYRDKDLLKFFRKMGKVRNENAFLKTADFKVVSIDEKQFVFERLGEKEKVIVFVSRTHLQTVVNVPSEYEAAEVISKIGVNPKVLEPYGAVALKLKM